MLLAHSRVLQARCLAALLQCMARKARHASITRALKSTWYTNSHAPRKIVQQAQLLERVLEHCFIVLLLSFFLSGNYIGEPVAGAPSIVCNVAVGTDDTH